MSWTASRPPVARALTAVLAAALLGALPAATAATAQTTPDGGDDRAVRLVITELQAVLGPGAVADAPSDDEGDLPTSPRLRARVLIEHTGRVPLGDLALVTEVFPAASSRSALRSALDTDGGLDGATSVHIDEQPLEDLVLEPGQIVGVDVVLDVEDIRWEEDGGVHPLRLALTRGASVLDEVRSAAVWLAAPVERPLWTAAVWPFDEAPWREAGGTYPRGVDGAVRPGGALDAQLRAVERHPGTGVVLAPPAHLLEDLRDRAGGYTRTERRDGGALETRRVAGDDEAARRSNELLGRLRVALEDGANPPLARPYADADLGSLAADEDTRSLAGELARAGRDRLDAAGQRVTEPRAFLLPRGAGPQALDLVPADTVVVPYRAIEGPDPAADPTLPSPVRDVTSAGGRPVTVLVADPYVTELLRVNGSTARAPLRAHRVLLETAMTYFETPGAEARALAVLPPEGWAPSAELAQRLLLGLDSAPWLTLVGPAEVVARAQPGPPGVLRPADAPAVDAADRARVRTALGDLEAVWRARRGGLTAVDDDDGRIADRDPAALRDELLRATSRWYPPGSTVREGLLADVEGAVRETLDSVTLADGGTVTLTAETGTIPVTLALGEGGPIDVRVEVASQARLTWPEGASTEVIRLQPGTTQTVSFATRALSTGDFSVTVRVTDPSGRLELDRTALSVRSTAVAGPALAIIAGLVVVLLAVGLLRRPTRRALKVVR